MAFYVRRTLASGPIRFAVAERRSSPNDNDSPTRLSTDPEGNFRRFGTDESLYFTEEQNVALSDFTAPSAAPVADHTSFWELLRPDFQSGRGWPVVASVAIGLLLVLIGIAVVATKDEKAGGVIEILIGLALILWPVIPAAKRYRELKAIARSNREERAQLEEERRRVVGAFADVLDDMVANPGPQSLAAVRRERQVNPIPVNIVAPIGRAAVAQFGYHALSRVEKLGTNGVAAAINEAADAVGLLEDDARAAKTLVFQKALWHLLADDRLTDERERLLRELMRDLDVRGEDVTVELRAVEEVKSLRGIDLKHLPLIECGAPLRFAEFCHHRTEGGRYRAGQQKPSEIYVSQKRVLIAGRSQESFEHPEIFGLEVDADRSVVEITLRDKKAPVFLQVRDPIRTAQLIDLAGKLPPKPKGLI